MFGEVFFEFLIREGGVARERHVRDFQVKSLAEFLVTEVGGVLVRHSLGNKLVVGNRKGKLAALRLGIHDAVKIISAARLQLKAQILNLKSRHDSDLWTCARVGAKPERGSKSLS